jgi:hypothetical protein
MIGVRQFGRTWEKRIRTLGAPTAAGPGCADEILPQRFDHIRLEGPHDDREIEEGQRYCREDELMKSTEKGGEIPVEKGIDQEQTRDDGGGHDVRRKPAHGWRGYIKDEKENIDEEQPEPEGGRGDSQYRESVDDVIRRLVAVIPCKDTKGKAALGFNPGVTKPSGRIVEDARIFGCIEMGLGKTLPSPDSFGIGSSEANRPSHRPEICPVLRLHIGNDSWPFHNRWNVP